MSDPDPRIDLDEVSISDDDALLDDEGIPAPFEDSEQYSFVGGVWTTVTEVLGDPRAFFERTQTDGAILDAYLYSLVVSGIPGALAGLVGAFAGAHFQFQAKALAFPLYSFAAAPLTVIVFAALGSAVIQVALGMMGVAVRPWRETLRVMFIGSTPGVLQLGTAVIAVIIGIAMGDAGPMGGAVTGSVTGLVGLAVGVWSLIIGVHGLKHVHGATTGQAWIAVLIMPILMLIVIGVAITFAIAYFSKMAP